VPTDHLLQPFDPLRAAVGDYLGALQAEGKSPKTLRNYGGVLERFRALAAPVDPAVIDAGLLRRWLRALAEAGLSGTTQHTYLTRVKSWLRWLEAEESYGVDAAFLRRVKPPRIDTEQPDPFTDEEVERLFRACRANTWTGQRMRTMIALLLDTAIRESELCGLRLADVDLERGEITVRAETSKSRRTRAIALGARAKREMGRWWRLKRSKWDPRPGAAWFLGWNELPVQARTLHRLLTRHGDRAGVPRANPHRFRHTGAIWALRAGMNPLAVMHMLGHTDLAMTKRYIKLANADVSAEKRAKSPLDGYKGRF
jgi:integrase/recombinase XerD